VCFFLGGGGGRVRDNELFSHVSVMSCGVETHIYGVETHIYSPDRNVLLGTMMAQAYIQNDYRVRVSE
jgi:hypothetical protein